MSWQRSARTIAGLAVAMTVAAAGCSHAGGGQARSSAAPSPVPSTPAPGPSAGEALGSASMPRGFVATDMTFVSPQTGWLVGTVGCTSQPCPAVVAATSDGGRTWTRAGAPGAAVDHAALRFANQSVGYLYGTSSLYLTSDGGRTWSGLPGQADAIEVGNGTALRISHATPGCPPGCTYQISSAPVGTGHWQPVAVAGAPLMGVGVQLLRTGHRAFAAVFQHITGGAQDAHAILLTSADDGGHWTRRADPCGTWAGQEADTIQMAVADDGSLSILCTQRVGGPSFVITSGNGGASFGPQHKMPAGAAVAIGAANAATLLVAVSTGATVTLYHSTDAGASWAQVATAPGPAQDSGGTGVLGFENARTGRWVPGSAAVLTTNDAGKTWTTFNFPA